MRPDLQKRLQRVASVSLKLIRLKKIAEQLENTNAMTNSGNVILSIVAKIGVMLNQMSELFNQMSSFQFPPEDLDKVKVAKERLLELHDILSSAGNAARKKAREIVPVLTQIRDFARANG